jgi:hypothetical protein
MPFYDQHMPFFRRQAPLDRDVSKGCKHLSVIRPPKRIISPETSEKMSAMDDSRPFKRILLRMCCLKLLLRTQFAPRQTHDHRSPMPRRTDRKLKRNKKEHDLTRSPTSLRNPSASLKLQSTVTAHLKPRKGSGVSHEQAFLSFSSLAAYCNHCRSPPDQAHKFRRFRASRHGASSVKMCNKSASGRLPRECKQGTRTPRAMLTSILS